MHESNDQPYIPSVSKRWKNPWFWLTGGLIATFAAFLWARFAGEGHAPLEIAQVSLAMLGVLLCGVALWIRCAQAQPTSLNDFGPSRRLALYILAGLHVLLIAGVCVWAGMKLLTQSEEAGTLPGDVGGIIILLLLCIPWCVFATHQLVLRAGDVIPVSEHFETALLVTQAGAACLLGSWALYWGQEYSGDWDSLRLFVAVGGGVAFLFAPIVAAPRAIRRFALSCLIVLHFAGILCAVMGTAPGPFILMQAHHWFFRPYLDFMYLNNAYRFYAPEPGPASQLWMRIEYDDGTYHWMKLPDINDRGQHRYSMSLQYTRRLALTENVARTGLPPAMMIPGRNGEFVLADFARKRVEQSPMPPEKKLGEVWPKNSLEVPMHPDLQLNYQPPTPDGERLLASYARHVLGQPHPEKPNAKPQYVKIYRVQHRLLPAEVFAGGADPRDWVFFLPYYMGKFDTKGFLVDKDDPFRYWLLPILRERIDDPRSDLKFYVYKHAGDEKWKFPAPPSWGR